MSEIMGVLFAIMVGILVIPKFADYQTASNDNTRAAVTAQQQKQINTAASAYIQTNSVNLQALATATVPQVITVAMLQTAGLPAAFSPTNPYGQTWQVEVLQPTAGNLQALTLSTGGQTLLDKQAVKIAAIVGATGGFIPQNDSGTYPGAAANAWGAFAGWTIPTTNYTSITGGHPASLLTFNNGQLASPYLYRNAVGGQPQLNAMNVPLVMNSVQTVGSACIAGAIARDATGSVLSCNVGTLLWKAAGGGSQYWQDPVANFASLPACNAAGINQTRLVQTPSVGVGPRAFACNGAAWKPLGVADDGTLYANRGTFSRDGAGPYTDGTINLSEWTAGTGKTASISLHNFGVHEGTIELAGNGARRIIMHDTQGAGLGLELTGELQLDRVQGIGGGCSPNGTLARDGSGLMLSCQNGVWENNYACRSFAGDLNWLEGQPGSVSCYNGNALGNAPTADFYFVEVTRHFNAGNYYVSQRATIMTGGAAGTVYVRAQQSGTAGSGWSAWKSLGGSDTASLTNPGYTEMPSGLIIQWGFVAGWTCMALPKPWPHAGFSVTGSRWSGNGSIGEFGAYFSGNNVCPGTNGNTGAWTWVAFGW